MSDEEVTWDELRDQDVENRRVRTFWDEPDDDDE